MKQASVIVIIPTLNRAAHLIKCLGSIKKQTILPAECIIVDQSDNDETKKLFESFDFGPVKKTYVHQKIKSLILARNLGLDNCGTSEYICFLDDDLELFEDFFEKLLARFEQDISKVFAGGMGTFDSVRKPNNLLARAFLLPHYGSGKFLANGAPTYPHWMQNYAEVEFLSGGITMFRAPILKMHRYDERLIGYGHGDDVDVSFRISRKYKMFYEPTARCHHDDHSPGRDPGTRHRKQLVQNLFYLMQKNIGLNFKSVTAYIRLVIGFILDDLVHRRRSALIGNFQAIFNILRGDIDSVTGYQEFKKTIKNLS